MAVLLHQPRELGDILIKKADGFDQVFAEQAQARDDCGEGPSSGDIRQVRSLLLRQLVFL